MSHVIDGPVLGTAADAQAPDDGHRTSPARSAKWGGRFLSGLLGSLLLLDGAMKLVQPAPVVDGTLDLGYPLHAILPLGIILIGSTLLYLIPQTAVLGAILLTGYLGGAVATHVRVDHPLLTHTLFPIYLGVLLWGALYLRDPRLRALVPLRRKPAI